MRPTTILAATLALGGVLAAGSPANGGGYAFTTFDIPGALQDQGGTVPNGVNDLGQIVGIVGNNTGQHGFLYDGGHLTIIDVPGAFTQYTLAYGINNSTQIVGAFTNTSQHGFLYSNGGFTTLDVPAAPDTGALGINNKGQIVGVFTKGGSPLGFLYSGGSFTTIAVPGAIDTYANGINNKGQLVGVFSRPSANFEGYVYSDGNFFTRNVPGALITLAQGINDEGQVVGNFFESGSGTHGFIFTEGNFVTIDVPGSTLTNVTGINNWGQIAGNWYDSGNVEHGFIGTPVPSFAGTPGQTNCYGQTVSALSQQFGGLNAAAADRGFSDMSPLQNAIRAFCGL